MNAIETPNKFLVGIQGDDICILSPIPRLLSKSDALLLAAFLVAMADADPGEDRPAFDAYLDAVQAC